MKFDIRSHPLAPLFNDPAQAGLLIEQLITEIQNGRYSTANAEIRNIFRQAALTQYWLFLKFVAGYAGPYDEINDNLHLDMCNWRSSDFCMEPGARFAGVMPRGAFKSTLFTHGALAWEALRWPNIRTLTVNSVEERAYQFCMNAFRTFRNNELVEWLFPEYVPPKGSAQMVLPNRTRFFTEPTFGYKGFSGELAGTHVNLINFDDIVGVEDLDSQMMASVSMERGKRKFATASTALLVKPPVDRVGMSFTRYAVDDIYDEVLKECKTLTGYQSADFAPQPKGVWNVYYRKPIEYGESINSEIYTQEGLDRLKAKDPWAYWTQMENSPKEGSSLEFYNFHVHLAYLEKDDEGYWLVRPGIGFDTNPPGRVHLGKCDVVVGVDFAASERGMGARISRTAIEMIAMDGETNKYLVEEHCGTFKPRETINRLFALNEKFAGYIRTNILESNAMQKFFIPLIREEAWARNTYFPSEAQPVSAPKEVRIRAACGPALESGNFYIVSGQGKAFEEERAVFPQSEYRRDALDAASKAFSSLRKPWSEEEEMEFQIDEEEWIDRKTSRAGY